jgi:hypothetical protein
MDMESQVTIWNFASDNKLPYPLGLKRLLKGIMLSDLIPSNFFKRPKGVLLEGITFIL